MAPQIEPGTHFFSCPKPDTSLYVPAEAETPAEEPLKQTFPAGQSVITPPVQNLPAGQSEGTTYPARVHLPAGASTSAAPAVAVTFPAVELVQAPRPAMEEYPGEH